MSIELFFRSSSSQFRCVFLQHQRGSIACLNAQSELQIASTVKVKKECLVPYCRIPSQRPFFVLGSKCDRSFAVSLVSRLSVTLNDDWLIKECHYVDSSSAQAYQKRALLLDHLPGPTVTARRAALDETYLIKTKRTCSQSTLRTSRNTFQKEVQNVLPCYLSQYENVLWSNARYELSQVRNVVRYLTYFQNTFRILARPARNSARSRLENLVSPKKIIK